jgi:hypothetical protein
MGDSLSCQEGRQQAGSRHMGGVRSTVRAQKLGQHHHTGRVGRAWALTRHLQTKHMINKQLLCN